MAKSATPRRRSSTKRPAPRWSAYVRRVRAGKVDDRATKYAADVVAGKIVAGPWVRLACKRHLHDLKRTDLTWDLEAANQAIAFFELVLKLNGGEFEGKPFLLQLWQAFIVGSLFGWKRPDGTRRFRKGLIEAGKGNGKSPLIAGIGLKGTVADSEPRAEVYFAAPKKDQAFIPFRDAVAMVDLSPFLSKSVKRSGGDPVWNLAYPKTGSFARPIASDDRQSGPRPHMGLLDELHEHANSIVVDLMVAGAKGRRQPLVLGITNSGFDRETVCGRWHDYSLRILQGFDRKDAERDDTWFAYVCALDEGDDPLNDEGCWLKANPNLGVSIQLGYLREQVQLAKGMPAQENTVRRLNFCQWTEAAIAWIPPEKWDACDAAVVLAQLAGRPCFGGLDLSSTMDLSGFVLEFPPASEGEPWQVLSFPYIPRARLIERARRESVPYDAWERSGKLFVTEGDVVDQDAIKLKVLELAGQFRILEVAFDRWNATKLVTELQGEGLTMVPVGQGFQSLSAPTKDIEALVVGRRVAHGGHPVLRWMVGNTSIRQDPAGNVKPDKAKSRDRIDLVVAWAMAHSRAMVVPVQSSSVYDEREVLVV